MSGISAYEADWVSWDWGTQPDLRRADVSPWTDVAGGIDCPVYLDRIFRQIGSDERLVDLVNAGWNQRDTQRGPSTDMKN